MQNDDLNSVINDIARSVNTNINNSIRIINNTITN